MVSYEVSREAKEDLYRIWRHGLERFGITQADAYLDALIDRFQKIADQPYLYPAVDHIRPGYRRSVCGVDSIYYRVTDGRVQIVRVLGRQDASSKL